MILERRGITRYIRLLAIVLSLLTIASSLFGMGKRENALTQADKLIQERRYDEAMRILADFASKNPDKFTSAQDRLQRISQLQERYYLLAEELLDVLERDPDNGARMLALSEEIARLEPSGSSSQEFMVRIRELALFTVNRRELERVLAEGRSQIERRNYNGAMNAYVGGLSIYQDEFFGSGFGAELESQVRDGIQTITQSALGAQERAAPLARNITALERLAEQRDIPQPQVFGEPLLALQEALGALADLKDSLRGVGNFYQHELAVLQEANKVQGDRSFLSFAPRLLDGAAASTNEGIIGVVARFWSEAMLPAEAALSSIADRVYARGIQKIRNREYGGAIPDFETLRAYLSLALGTEASWRRFYAQEDMREERIFDYPIPEIHSAQYLTYVTMNLAAEQLLAVDSLGERYQGIAALPRNSFERWQAGETTFTAALASEEVIISGYGEIRAELDPLIEDITSQTAPIESYQEAFDAAPDALRYNADAFAAARELRDILAEDEQGAGIRFFTMVNEGIREYLVLRESEFNQASEYLAGEVSQTEDEEESRVLKRPLEALAILTRMNGGIDEDIETVRELTERYRDVSDLALEGPMRELYQNAQAMAERLNEYKEEGAALIPQTQTQVTQAANLRREGDRLFQEAQNALANDNFEVARDRALRAGELYDLSLGLQESPDLRDLRDNRLVTLGDEIVREENEVVVREVRQLVTEARAVYFSGDLAQADDLLSYAYNRWQVTNAEPDPEITYWLTVVRGAMNLRSGRNIPPTAPLYAEMSQLLSNAHRSYEEGVRLLNNRNRIGGIAKFDEARRFTQEVKLLFPVNQDAGILELRIDQVTDPQAFNASFGQRLSAAVAGTRRGSVESYADLQNLAQINPRYPNIRGILVQAEIDMGIRPPPPDARALARSNELTAQARGLIDQNVRAQFPIALEQLNQALELNPENAQAMAQKDRVQTLLGGGSIVLSAAAERLYQQAVQELQAGNTVTAMAITQQLLQDPQNRNSTRIMELQRRIESIL